MASDSQILALSTMFTEDVFTFYGGTARFGPNVQVQMGRLFVVLLTLVAYAIALRVPQSIFDLASQFAFAGYSALSPLLVAALFWRRSTKWGALAVVIWVALRDRRGRRDPDRTCRRRPDRRPCCGRSAAWRSLSRAAAGLLVFNLLPVVPLTIGSALLMWLVSMATPAPGPRTLARYF